MELKKFDKRYLPMLWIGLAVWALGWGMSLLLEVLGVEMSGQENLMGMVKGIFQDSHFFVLFLTCVLVPFLEECSFRLWAVGKKWSTTICLVGMVLFVAGEIGQWAILAVVAMVSVPRMVKSSFLSNCIRSLISALCFALCHISGFNGLSWGMVFGLADIFGMALVMCWLVINMGFWYSVLLHVLNNTIALLLPMLFLASPVATDGDDFSTEISALKPLASNTQLVDGASSLFHIDSTIKEFYLVGEPAEIACYMFELLEHGTDVFFDWESETVNLDDRVKYQVTRHTDGELDISKLAASFCKNAEQFRGKPFSVDTARVMVKTIWLVYEDGYEEPIDEATTTNRNVAFSRLFQDINGKAINFCEPTFDEDCNLSAITNYVLPKAHPAQTQPMMTKLQSSLDKIYGFRLEYRDDHEVTLITIR